MIGGVLMKFRPLAPWVKGNSSVTPINFYSDNKPELSMGAFLSLDIAVDLHLAHTVSTGTLENSWAENQAYIKEACAIANTGEEYCFDLDGEDKRNILDELGEPPECSYNIYFITIYNESEEKVVYVGKTDSKNGRFANGHLAALKLHDPKYSAYQKRVYFGTITLLSKDLDYIPLEFITPYEEAKRYLNGVEGFLIDRLNPELNTRKEKIDIFEEVSQIHIQNFSEVSDFMDDFFVS